MFVNFMNYSNSSLFLADLIDRPTMSEMLLEKACSEIKRYRRRRAMKISTVGEGAE
jgi:hypothetical protein